MGYFLTDDTDGTGSRPGWPTYQRQAVLRYGENLPPAGGPCTPTASARPARRGRAAGWQGNELQQLRRHGRGATGGVRLRAGGAIIKHSNPCGIATGRDIADAHARAHACDPVSAYGGVIAANRTVTLAMAEQVRPIFTEVIVAPGYEPAALEVLQAKKNLRILVADAPARGGVETRPIDGGLLMQVRDVFQADGDDPATWELKAGAAVDAETLADLAFAWRACRAVKSNAILRDRRRLRRRRDGPGQPRRLVQAAVERAGERARGAVAASDAFSLRRRGSHP